MEAEAVEVEAAEDAAEAEADPDDAAAELCEEAPEQPASAMHAAIARINGTNLNALSKIVLVIFTSLTGCIVSKATRRPCDSTLIPRFGEARLCCAGDPNEWHDCLVTHFAGEKTRSPALSAK